MSYLSNSSLFDIIYSSRISPSPWEENLWNSVQFMSLISHCGLLYLFSTLVIIIVLFITTKCLVDLFQCSGIEKRFEGTKRVLLVTAHPDDECMFFGPTLTDLTSKADVYILCLSEGGYDGLSAIRSNELWESCSRLGVNRANIRLVRHPHLPDSPKSSWSPVLIGRLISQFVETVTIDTLLTFDAHGVSGHPNHSAIYRAVMHLSGKRAIPSYCKIYVLESVSLLRKYFICTDLFLSYCTSEYIYVSSPVRRRAIVEAMNEHQSQLVWFRRLYLIFSRYVYINTFKIIS